MDRVHKLWARSSGERRLLAHALLFHAAVVVALRLVPFGRLREWGSIRYGGRPRLAPDQTRVIWAVRTAAALMPFGRTCLSEALTAHWLMAACGHESVVRFGVAPAASRRFTAHAWLESPSLTDDCAAGYALLSHPKVRP